MSNPGATQLQALITYANEVTGASDTKISDAVATLASGYGQGGDSFNPFAYMYNGQEIFRDQELPETLTLDFSGNANITTLYNAFRSTTGIKNLTIKNLTTDVNLYCFALSTTAETITFEDCTFSATNLQGAFQSCASLTTINGEIDCTNCTNMSYIFNMSELLTDFRFKENTISASLNSDLTHYNAVISDASWVSLANGLRADSPNTVKFRPNAQTAIDAILGTNDNGTFMQDANGSMTLTDFITNVKGWTIS